MQAGELGEVGAQPGADPHLARVRLGAHQRLVEVGRIAQQGQAGHRGQAADQLRHLFGAMEGERRQPGHHGRAVHDREAFLGLQLDGAEAGLGEGLGRTHHLAVVENVPLTGEGAGDVAERGQVAAGPDRAFGRDQRQDVEAQHVAEQADEIEADARPAAHQGDQAHGHHGPGLVRFQHAAEATAVETGQVQRQFCDQGIGHAAGDAVAIAGGDAVDHTFTGQGRLDMAGRAGDGGEGGFLAGQAQGDLTRGQGPDIVNGKVAVAKGDTLAVAGKVVHAVHCPQAPTVARNHKS